jgi:hypothetical protein
MQPHQGNRFIAAALAPSAEAEAEFLEALQARNNPPVLPQLVASALRDGGYGAETLPSDDEGRALHDAWNQLGDDLFTNSSRGFQAAEHAYRMAIASAPICFSAYRGLGECLARRKRLREALIAHDLWFARWIASDESAGLRKEQDGARERHMPAIMLVAMQKSASEHIRDALMRILGVPLIYVSVGTVPVDVFLPSALRQLATGGALARSHASAGDNLRMLADAGIDRLILHARDPRQVVVSWAYMMAGLSDVEFRYSATMYDPPVPDDYRSWGIDRQLAWSIEHYLPGQLAWLEGWAAAIDRNPAIRTLVTTYEEFHRDQRAHFARMLNFLAVECCSDWNGLLEPAPANTRNFRRGQTDEWRQLFTPAQCASVWSRLAPLAERFGWRA